MPPSACEPPQHLPRPPGTAACPRRPRPVRPAPLPHAASGAARTRRQYPAQPAPPPRPAAAAASPRAVRQARPPGPNSVRARPAGQSAAQLPSWPRPRSSWPPCGPSASAGRLWRTRVSRTPVTPRSRCNGDWAQRRRRLRRTSRCVCAAPRAVCGKGAGGLRGLLQGAERAPRLVLSRMVQLTAPALASRGAQRGRAGRRAAGRPAPPRPPGRHPGAAARQPGELEGQRCTCSKARFQTRPSAALQQRRAGEHKGGPGRAQTRTCTGRARALPRREGAPAQR